MSFAEELPCVLVLSAGLRVALSVLTIQPLCWCVVAIISTVLVSSITLDYYYTATERLVDFLCSIVRSNLCSIINKIIISELDMEKALV